MKKRLDMLLVERGICQTRSKAQSAIKSGIVYVDGNPSEKAGACFEDTVRIELHGGLCPYVSRGGLKLEKALNTFDVDPSGWICSDSGASTGGFTDCLLQKGAQKVFAIDVGVGQLDSKLRCDPRVVVMENTNIRYVTPAQLGQLLDLSVVDVSFISLRLVLPAVKSLLKPGKGQVMCLIKPQFEAGKQRIGKNGVVRDPKVHKEVLDEFVSFVGHLGFTLKALTFSPVLGPEGNIEFLGHLTLADIPEYLPDTARLISDAHCALKG